MDSKNKPVEHEEQHKIQLNQENRQTNYLSSEEHENGFWQLLAKFKPATPLASIILDKTVIPVKAFLSFDKKTGVAIFLNSSGAPIKTKCHAIRGISFNDGDKDDNKDKNKGKEKEYDKKKIDWLSECSD